LADQLGGILFGILLNLLKHYLAGIVGGQVGYLHQLRLLLAYQVVKMPILIGKGFFLLGQSAFGRLLHPLSPSAWAHIF